VFLYFLSSYKAGFSLMKILSVNALN